MANSCWSKRTGLEKLLTASCIVMGLAAIGLLVGVIVLAVNKNNDLDGICMSKACIAESSSVLAHMNLTADPCDNFFEFACGSFLAETVIPDDKSSVTSFSVITNKMKEQLRLIVAEPITSGEIAPFVNVKNLYKACMNTDAIENLGSAPVLNVLNAQGGWPVVVGPSWDSAGWTWQTSVALSRIYGYSVSYFLSFSVSTDNKDSTKRIIRIDQASLGLSREYLIEGLEEPFVKAYHDYQVDLAVLFGAVNSTATATEMREVLEFETQLAMISMDREERRDADKLYNLRTITQLNSDYSYNNWLSYFNDLLPEESQLVESDQVIVGALSFFEQLGTLLAATPNRVKANYALWRQAVSSVSYMPKDFKTRQEVYSKATTGRATADPLWLQCVDQVLNFYPHAFGSLYVRKHFNEDAKKMALDMVNNIKNEFNEILKGIDWMDDKTKEKAKEKADKMKEQIGYATEMLDDSKLTAFYNEWPSTVDEANFYASVFALNIASSLRANKRLRLPIDKDEWTSQITPAIVNAFYSSLENSIKFPAGILQGAFFNAERPQYMNYGGIGFVIGHEITHGFDDQGSQYDGEGNLQNWWEADTRSKYLERAKCIINQYGNYTEPLSGLKLNGVNTQGENIADNGGIKQSYKAYVRWADKNPEQTMPGLNYSPQQMFWISAGQVWCSTYREETIKNQVTTGVHSPGQFRVIGPMSNMKEFSADFNCPSNSKMNPASKCEVW